MKDFRELPLCSSTFCVLHYSPVVSIRFLWCTISSQKKPKRYQQCNWKTKGQIQCLHRQSSGDSSPLCLHYHKNNVIVFHLNTVSFWKVKDSYMFRLAEVAIMRLNVKNKMKKNTYDCNLCFEISYLQKQYVVCVNM